MTSGGNGLSPDDNFLSSGFPADFHDYDISGENGISPSGSLLPFGFSSSSVSNPQGSYLPAMDTDTRNLQSFNSFSVDRMDINNVGRNGGNDGPLSLHESVRIPALIHT